MTVCTEPDLLEAAGIAARSRIREIDEKVYLRELLRSFPETGTASTFWRIRSRILRCWRI